MDSLSQLVLGAAVCAAIVPRRCRRTALVAGALLGTLPDLDVLPLSALRADVMTRVTWHRGPSHSLFVLAVAGWMLWLAARRWWQPVREAPMRWLVAIEGALLTHPLLDAFTVYGTQLFWPFPGSPIMWSSIFIIDPLYTLPLLVGCVAAWFLREKRASDTWLRAALILSTGYLGWSLVAKAMVEREIARAGLAEHPHFTTPTPFNTLLWRVVVMTPDGYLEGERSLVADTGPLRLTPHGTNTKALAEVEDFPAVKRLRWFTRGFMKAEEENGLLVVSDLRLGATPHFPFRYVVAEREGSQLRQVPARWAQREFELGSMLDGLWDRIWEGSAVPSSEVSAP